MHDTERTKRGERDPPGVQLEIDPTVLLSVRQVAERLGLSRSSVYLLMEQGQLAYVKLGRTRRIQLAALVELIESNRSVGV